MNLESTTPSEAQNIKESGKLEVVKTWSRKSTILPMFVRITCDVHNRKKFLLVLVTEVGTKLGEFGTHLAT